MKIDLDKPVAAVYDANSNICATYADEVGERHTVWFMKDGIRPAPDEVRKMADHYAQSQISAHARRSAMILVYCSTKNPVKVGDIVKDFRGDPCAVTSWTTPVSEHDSGRVYIRWLVSPRPFGYCPSSFGMMFVDA